MTEELVFGQLQVRVAQAPPVYDPGGDTWIVIGAGPAADFESVLDAAHAQGAAQVVAPRGEVDVLQPLGFEPMSDFWTGKVEGSGGAQDASEDDLPFLLDLAAKRRAEYGTIQPVFWREARHARSNQERWFRHLLGGESARILCNTRGFLIATARGGTWMIDDFCVVEPADWLASGKRLLTTLAGDVEVVCARHDEGKQALMRDVGLEPAHTWFQKTINAAP